MIEGENAVRRELDQRFASLIIEDSSYGTQVSYVANKSEPFLRWFRFKEAFGAQFVRRIFEYMKVDHKDYILDPWCGMGTTPFVSSHYGLKSVGLDNLPLAVFVAKTLTQAHKARASDINQALDLVRRQVKNIEPSGRLPDIPIIKKALTNHQMTELLRWKEAILTLKPGIVRDILKLVLMNVIQDVSKTSQDGQFLRLVEKSRQPSVEPAFERRLQPVFADLSQVKLTNSSLPIPEISEWDSRELSTYDLVDLPTCVVTSPPYLNRYDYSRSYVLQLSLWFISTHDELKEIRFRKLLRSHIESKVPDGEKPRHPAVREILDNLACQELNNPRIPYMIMAYFNDMEKCINGMSERLAKHAKVALVVDNARYQGQHVPTDLILSDIAAQHGFETKKIIVARYKGNSSQQMRRYGKSPTRESIVLWELN